MALGAHSETYSGVSMDAAPIPKPATRRAMYMHASEPLDPACSATPVQVSIPAPTRGHFRPNRSATREAWGEVFSGERRCFWWGGGGWVRTIRLAKKQPAWRVDTTCEVEMLVGMVRDSLGSWDGRLLFSSRSVWTASS